ncbi:MAG TPA: putative 7-carboxy-7-deazaguanine synthase QueE [Firmicutes bacterium]|nr:putative 7-carboxy-7-deazaguanine synthase QueE [Bacillota bacterium]HAX00895.1 putative 7-carboxy-7-deazaguanine synthase QueE [Bacillota bacterium]
MRVVEKFVSINGEGLRSGELAVFIRFANCNLRCSYCDTKYSFINPIYTEESVDELVRYVKSTGVKNVTLTGGEPLIQNEIKELMIELSNIGNRIEIETNGSINIAPYLNIPNVTFTLDYKLKGSGMEKYMDLTNYDLLRKNDVIKFVVSDYDDLEKTKEIIKKYDLINKANCLISPVWGRIEFEEIVNFLKDNKLNDVKMQLQIHKIIWDKDKRGV